MFKDVFLKKISYNLRNMHGIPLSLNLIVLNIVLTSSCEHPPDQPKPNRNLADKIRPNSVAIC